MTIDFNENWGIDSVIVNCKWLGDGENAYSNFRYFRTLKEKLVYGCVKFLWKDFILYFTDTPTLGTYKWTNILIKKITIFKYRFYDILAQYVEPLIILKLMW